MPKWATGQAIAYPQPMDSGPRAKGGLVGCVDLLVLTQAAGIEFAQGQGVLNTDPSDQFAGVDSSDHERQHSRSWRRGDPDPAR